MSTLATMAAALATGLFLGFVLTATYSASTRSRFQEHMQRKVLYWQGEADRAHDAADELARRLEAWEPSPSRPLDGSGNDH